MIKILLIEDDYDLAAALAKSLEKKGYNVKISHDGESGEKLTRNGNFDLMLLDLNLPKKDGLSICRDLRHDSNQTPIIMLTERSNIEDRVVGLNSGADDYLPKPFSLQELEARVQAVLRRQPYRKSVLQDKLFKLDPNTYEFSVGNRKTYLPQKQFAIIERLIREKGQIVTRSDLIATAWGEPIDAILSNTLEVHISRLRRVIGNSKCIKSITNRGYLFQPELIS